MTLYTRNFEVLSKNPLWTFGQDNEPELVQNIYDDIEVIRIYRYGMNSDKYYDIPIERITPVIEFGTFFFTSKEDCEKFKKHASSDVGRVCILENSFECSKRSKNITRFKENEDIPIENGIYVIKDFESSLFSFCEITDLVYIDENYEICDFKVADEDVEDYLVKYVKTIDAESRHSLNYERMIFEIYSEDGYVYINHFYIHDVGLTKRGLFFYTRILNYPIIGKREAELFLIKCDINQYIDSKQEEQIEMQLSDEEKERKKKLRMKIMTLCGSYVWEHKFELISNIKKIITTMKSTAASTALSII